MAEKNWFDILDIIIRTFGVFLPFILGALIGYYAHGSRMEQVGVSKLEVIEKFIPHIEHSPQRRAIALLALTQFGYGKEAIEFGRLYDDEETQSSIQIIRAGPFKSKETVTGSFIMPSDKAKE